MTTLQTFTQKLAENKLKFVFHADQIGDNFHTYMVGICFPGEHTYHWFKYDSHISSKTGEFHEYFRFDHSYSQLTGKTHKGWSWKMRIEKSVARRIKVEALDIL